MNHDMAVALWERALEAEIGTAIEILEPERRKITNLLYATKVTMRDPRYDAITIINPVRDKPEIWLVKKAVELDP
jgi:hypothetical protein